jgi:Rrf2 family protein
MKVTALEEYGLRCMVLLAKNDGGPLTLPEISSKEGLSLSYAGKLLMCLKKAGLVKAVRGRQGGYELSKSADEFNLKQIFDALGEPLYNHKHCDRYTGEEKKCIHKTDCNIRGMWKGFNQIIRSVLGEITLADLSIGNYDVHAIYESLKSET